MYEKEEQWIHIFGYDKGSDGDGEKNHWFHAMLCVEMEIRKEKEIYER